MARRQLRVRAPRDTGELVAAGIVTVAALTFLAEVATAVRDTAVRGWPYLAAAAAGGLGYGLWRALRAARVRRLRSRMLEILRLPLARIDAMEDRGFEEALRDLLVRDGWSARRVGQQGDQAADVIGRHPRWGRIVLQAKHTRVGGRVGSPVMYQVKGTAEPVHGADVAVVVTNGGFTRDARVWGERHRVHWVDRERLRAWAEDGVPLHVLLRLPSRGTFRRGVAA
ncbi:restriction endonuclease [Streptomyces sp. TRM 70361]|uniref:restriction endonuclease n=1 Tax=Streptomyces sp. TRM 70361 TaxID=3116553 RepID=UPI002E7B9341|nr:restriction endonuclease [Streptomyces sp. TRM 70361]MEE1942913.1 restriction endonuclease [Streptomyces sp. TRM 70361]